MDTTLVMVTLLSMGMAGALSVIVWRMLRDEKARADSRVAALVTLAGAPAIEHGVDLPMRETSTALREPLFVERHEESPWRQRFMVMAALGLVAASTILFTLAAGNTTAPAAAARQAPSGQQTTAVGAPAQPGLELISLRDSRENGALTITGLVHNPRTGGTLSRVAVTAYAFDENGTFLASGRALLDVASLVPGDESPFQVSVPVTGQVARYRIGFRGDDGRVIAHVDRRQQGPVAANW